MRNEEEIYKILGDTKLRAMREDDYDDGHEDGKTEGLLEGRAQGIVEGEMRAVNTMIENMKAQGITPEMISKITGKTVEYISSLTHYA